MAKKHSTRPATNRADDTGKRYNRLRVISFAGMRNHRSYWNCVCDCGCLVVVSHDHLRAGHAKSCGCLKIETSRANIGIAIVRAQAKPQGRKPRTPEYNAWRDMKRRCLVPKHKNYKDYGARGIKICEQWLHSFKQFLSDMGPRPAPDLSLDRINNDGNYEPVNCRWATKTEQTRNRRPRTPKN